MEPNFHNSEYLLTDKVSYRFREPQRGEVIVFKAPPDDKDEFIKRIIGLPGETISLQSGQFYINNTPLSENYINVNTPGGDFLSEGQTVTIPSNSYFVVGDNREHSFDSRAWGFIKREKINGRAWFLYWPIDSVGLVKKVDYSF